MFDADKALERRKIGASVLGIGRVGEVTAIEMVDSIGKDCLKGASC